MFFFSLYSLYLKLKFLLPCWHGSSQRTADSIHTIHPSRDFDTLLLPCGMLISSKANGWIFSIVVWFYECEKTREKGVFAPVTWVFSGSTVNPVVANIPYKREICLTVLLTLSILVGLLAF